MDTAPRKPTLADLQAYAHAFNQSIVLSDFGAKLSFPTPELVVVEIPEVKPNQRGGLGTEAVNGGVLAALFDVSIGCTPALIDPTKRSATVSLSMSFERPTTGNRVRCEAQISNVGGKMVFATARILDEQGNVTARAQGVTRMSTLGWKNTYGGVGAP